MARKPKQIKVPKLIKTKPVRGDEDRGEGGYIQSNFPVPSADNPEVWDFHQPIVIGPGGIAGPLHPPRRDGKGSGKEPPDNVVVGED